MDPNVFKLIRSVSYIFQTLEARVSDQDYGLGFASFRPHWMDHLTGDWRDEQ